MPKLVGLVAAKGESKRLIYFLKALSLIVDEIVYLDDNSPDDSLDIVQSIKDECRVSRIIHGINKQRNESSDKNTLLQAGREIGGEIFVVLDADEAFIPSSVPTVSSFLRQLKPGEVLKAPWTHVWRSPYFYRTDDCPWVNNWRPIAFGDDGISKYPDIYLHTPRIPMTPVNVVAVPSDVVFIHFQFVFWPNVLIKQMWYLMLERQRTTHNLEYLNWAYGQAVNEENLELAAVNKDWYYPFFEEYYFETLYSWRLDEMQQWKKEDPARYRDLAQLCPYISQ